MFQNTPNKVIVVNTAQTIGFHASQVGEVAVLQWPEVTLMEIKNCVKTEDQKVKFKNVGVFVPYNNLGFFFTHFSTQTIP